MSVVEVDGRVALVTGATSGIGRSSAMALAQVGFDIAAVGRRVDRLQSLVADLRKLGRACLPVPADITEADGADRVLDHVQGRWGLHPPLSAPGGRSPRARLTDPGARRHARGNQTAAAAPEVTAPTVATARP